MPSLLGSLGRIFFNEIKMVTVTILFKYSTLCPVVHVFFFNKYVIYVSIYIKCAYPFPMKQEFISQL